MRVESNGDALRLALHILLRARVRDDTCYMFMYGFDIMPSTDVTRGIENAIIMSSMDGGIPIHYIRWRLSRTDHFYQHHINLRWGDRAHILSSFMHGTSFRQ